VTWKMTATALAMMYFYWKEDRKKENREDVSPALFEQIIY
jgi:hypothetical protein